MGVGRFPAAVVTAVVSGALIFGSTGSGEAQQRVTCGSDLYTVRPGDSLSDIAQRAYSSFNYQVIFDANRDVLTTPSELVVGQQIFVPCLDGSGAASKAEVVGDEVAALGDPALPRLLRAEVETAARTEQQASAPGPVPPLDQPVRFLTGSDYAPYTHRDLPEGGMITELVNRAMQRADALRPYRISWENDWSRHLSELLPGSEYDLGFPWFRPDCGASGSLSPEMQRRCAEFDFSEPVYEVTIGYYVRAEEAGRVGSGMAALYGRRVCRPAGHFTFDLEAEGLVEPNVRMVRPERPDDCFAMLADGTVDVVTLDAARARYALASLGHQGAVVEMPELATVQTLHVVSLKSNPYGLAWLALIDAGLDQLRKEGIWREVTTRHMDERPNSL